MLCIEQRHQFLNVCYSLYLSILGSTPKSYASSFISGSIKLLAMLLLFAGIARLIASKILSI